MRLKSIFICALLIIAVINGGLAGTIPLLPDAESSQLKISENSSGDLIIEVGIESLNYQELNTPSGRFTQIDINGYHAAVDPGKPRLPVMNRIIEVPLGDNLDFEVEVLDYKEQMVSLQDIGISSPVIPSQPPLSKSVDPSTVPFEYDQAVYNKDEFYSEDLVSVEIRGIARYARLALLCIAPVSYNPVKGILKVRNNLRIKIRFINPDFNLTETMKSQYYSPYFESVLSHVANHRIDNLREDLTRYPVKYVIVSDPMFQAQLQPFIQWKREKGFAVVEAYTDDPEVGNTTSSIQSYLFDLYNAGTEDDPAPTFVLFVGDEDQIPAFNGTQGSHVTDLYYCDVTGDMLPDMYYGRFSAESPADLQPQIDKTLAMEMWTIGNDAFTGKAMLIAGWDSYHTTDWGWPQVNYGTENYFNATYNFTDVFPYLTTGSQQHVQEIIGHVSDGLTFVNYTAHGSETSWADPSFTESDINSLSNVDMYPTIVGNCCLTNAFDYYTVCFGETWLRVPDKGAVGYIGGTNSTYWDEDLWWAVGYHTIQHGAGGAAPDYDDTGMGAFDANFVFDYNTQGSMVFAGNLAVEESNSSMRDYYWEIYTLMGDPSYMTYMGIPQNNTVSLPSIIPVGVNAITIDADPGSYIALSRDGEVHAVYMKTSAGPVTIEIEPFMSPGDAEIVITCQNRFPFIQSIPVIVPAVVNITPAGLLLNQQDTVRVSVYDADGVLPLEGIHVWVSGWGVDSSSHQGFTNPAGEIALPVLPPFGEGILVEGQRSGDPYLLFSDTLFVSGGTDLTHADLNAAVPELGLIGKLTPYYEGTITGTADEQDISVHARGCGVDTMHTGMQLVVTPSGTGMMAAAVTKPGYNIYQELFEVVPVYGVLSGAVEDINGQPIAGVSVKGYPENEPENPVFSVSTDAGGFFNVPDSLQAGYYQIESRAFGYLQTDTAIFLGFGENQLTIQMPDAPYAQISGTVMDGYSSEPLTALVQIFRMEDGDLLLYLEDSTDSDEGTYSFNLPYYQYQIAVHARGFVPAFQNIDVNIPSLNIDFPLDASIGNILVLDDNPPGRDNSPGEDKSAAEITSVLTSMGFYTLKQNAYESDPEEWLQYDLVISSSGMNEDPVNSSLYRQALQDYVSAGGKLLIEGGEIGHDALQSPGFAQFSQSVLHVSSWSGDEAGSLIKTDYEHPIGSLPNPLPNVIHLDYVNSGTQDACIPAYGAYLVYKTEMYPAAGGVIVYDDNEYPESAQIVYYPFNWAAIQNQLVREELLENSVNYLLNPEGAGNSQISGTVALSDGNIPVNVKVNLLGTSRTAFTDSAGFYVLEDVLQGNWVVRASLEGYGYREIPNIIVGEADTITSVDFSLSPLEPLFMDDFEHGLNQWITEGGWDLDTENPYSGENNISDSPGGNYSNSTVSLLTVSEPVDFTDCSCSFLQFRQRYEFGPGDYGAVEVSYNGDFWQEVRRFTGVQDEWSETYLDLSGHTCHSMLYFRFKLYADDSQSGDGWSVDDVILMGDGGFPYRKGDVNHDGEINVVDIVSTVNIILSLSSPPNSPRFWCADMNEDDIIDIRDVIQIVYAAMSINPLAKSSGKQATEVLVEQRGNTLFFIGDGDVAGLEIVLKAGKMTSGTIPDGTEFYTNETGNHAILFAMAVPVISSGSYGLVSLSDGASVDRITAVSASGDEIPVILKTLPLKFALHQNYPNPFNPSTTLRFDLPKNEHVKMMIFDLRGRMVKKLLDSPLKAGYHTIVWNGKDAQGRSLPSGLYFCRLESGSHVKMIKLTLLK